MKRVFALIAMGIISVGCVGQVAEPGSVAPPEAEVPVEVESKPEPEVTAQEFDAFVELIEGVDGASALFSRYEHNGRILKVTVTQAFLGGTMSQQKEALAQLQALWAISVSPEDIDQAYVWAYTTSGRKIGGSRAVAGSMIYVDP